MTKRSTVSKKIDSCVLSKSVYAQTQSRSRQADNGWINWHQKNGEHSAKG